MTIPKAALCSCVVATVALLAGPTHAVSINSLSTPGAVAWTDQGASMHWQRKCDQALHRLDKAIPDTGAYAQFQLQRDKYCGVAAAASEVVAPHAPPMLEIIVSSPPIFASPPNAASEHADFVSPTAVPEPGALALLGLGLTGLALSRKRKAA